MRYVRNQFLSGDLQAGEKLPSARQLAQDLQTSPSTAQRALHELKKEGFIISIPGRGSVFSWLNQQKQKAELLAQLKELAEELSSLGMTKREIMEEVISASNGIKPNLSAEQSSPDKKSL